MNHRIALAWAGVLGATGVVLGALGAHRLKADPRRRRACARSGRPPSNFQLVHACRPAGVCGMAEGPPGRPGARRALGGAPLDRAARSSSRAPSTSWPWAAPVARARDAPGRPGPHRRAGSWPRARPLARLTGRPRPDRTASLPSPATFARCSRPCAASAGRGSSAAASATGSSAPTPRNFDIEVAGVDFEGLRRALAPFGPTDVVGPQLRRHQGARRRRRRARLQPAAPGVEDRGRPPRVRRRARPLPQRRGAAARRDFTVNAIALDPFTGALIDPFGARPT